MTVHTEPTPDRTDPYRTHGLLININERSNSYLRTHHCANTNQTAPYLHTFYQIMFRVGAGTITTFIDRTRILDNYRRMYEFYFLYAYSKINKNIFS